MNIYKIVFDTFGYDEYDALVVAAEDLDEAKRISEELLAEFNAFGRNQKIESVDLIGVSSCDIESGIILGSFNAG